MRLWSVHPRYLDRQGLTATWREALLAQAVLAGRTKGYRNHPQLRRFAATTDPVSTVGAYLEAIASEAADRGYRYDRARINERPEGSDWQGSLEVTTGQLEYEWGHLVGKLSLRSPDWLAGDQVGRARSRQRSACDAPAVPQGRRTRGRLGGRLAASVDEGLSRGLSPGSLRVRSRGR